MTDALPFLKQELEESIVARWRRVVLRFAERVAVTAPDGEQVTYQAIDERSDQIAGAIIDRLGIENAQVIFFLEHTPLLIVSMIGALKANKAYIAFDPAQTIELARLLATPVAPRLIVTTFDHLSIVRPVVGLHQDVLLLEDVHETGPQPYVEISPDALAALFFTSGTAGLPKGVPYSHRMILHRIWVETNTYQLTADDRFSGLRAAGVAASVRDIFNALLNGGALCLYPIRQYGLTHLSTWVLAQGVTYLHLPGTLYREWLGTLPEQTRFPTIRYLSPSGRKTRVDCERAWPHLNAEACMINTYATTETSLLCQERITRQTPLQENMLSVGKPVPDKQITLVDEHDQPVAAGQVGEVIVRSRYIAGGYWQQPELSAQRFRRADHGSGDVIYRTGDFGRLRGNGELEILGRKDAQVKVRGYRVMLDDVETRLAQVTGVVQAAAKVFPTPGGDNRLVGYVSVRPGTQVSASTIRTELEAQVAAHMVPGHIVILPHLPLTQTGKVDRFALPQPGRARPLPDTPYVAPRNELEQQIADIWAELLELDEVGVEDNFFELGGDSILAMRMALAVERATGQRVPPEFFGTSTVAHLADMIATARPPGNLAQHPAASRAFGKKARQSSRLTPRRLLSHLTFNGPMVRGHGLPYGLGVQLQRWWVRLPVIRQQLLRGAASFRTWLAILGRDDADGHALELSLLANTWRFWREDRIQQPGVLGKWVTVQGGEQLDAALASGQPIVLVGTHTAIRGGAMRMAIRQRAGREVWTLGHTPTGVADAAARTVYARELLAHGGIVHVTGDGAQGKRGVALPIYGRPWLFRSGGAELALDTGAVMLPVINTLAHSGQIMVEFLEPLTDSCASRSQQIAELTRQYAALLIERWPDLLSNMKWNKLQQILDYANRQSEP